MKKKAILMTAFGLIILLAVIAAALNALFTVTKIKVVWATCSKEGEAESIALQDKLEDSFVGKSSTFLDLDDVREIVGNYACFELISVEKSYPQTVVLEVAERKEVFSFRRENGLYAVLDGNGLFLYDKENNTNRMGGENVLLEGFSLTATEAGAPAEGEFTKELLAMSAEFTAALTNIRANVVSVELLEHRMEGKYFRIQMTEGVYFDIYTPENNTEEKAKKAIAAYTALSYEEKLYGYFDVMDLADSDQFTVSRHYPNPVE